MALEIGCDAGGSGGGNAGGDAGDVAGVADVATGHYFFGSAFLAGTAVAGAAGAAAGLA